MASLFDLPSVTPTTPADQFLKDKVRQQIPRYRCFSLSDFSEFERCSFRFFVKHHLGKKYELEEGSPNKALGSLLDLTIKKIHKNRLYNQPIEFLVNTVKASEAHMREKAQKEGPHSYFGPQIPYLTPDVVDKAKKVLESYLKGLPGGFQKAISFNTFWSCDLVGSDGESLRLWGGPDILELGKDGIPEIVDFKYYENQEKGKDYLDMDLMPKLYTLLVAEELKKLGFKKARFKIRFWQDPLDESLYEEFDLDILDNFKSFFQQKAENILRATEVSFCEKDYCKACKGEMRYQWEKECRDQVWIKP